MLGSKLKSNGVAKASHEQKHLEERLLDQAQVLTPYTPPFGGHSRSIPPRHDIGCLTPGKIIILGDGMIPKEFFNFEPSTPLHLHTTFSGVGVGARGLGLEGQKFCA